MEKEQQQKSRIKFKTENGFKTHKYSQTHTEQRKIKLYKLL